MKVLLVGKEDGRESSVFAEHLGVIVRIPERHAAVFSVHFDKQLFGAVRIGKAFRPFGHGLSRRLPMSYRTVHQLLTAGIESLSKNCRKRSNKPRRRPKATGTD